MPRGKTLINIIKLPRIIDDCVLCFAQTPEQIPFKIARIYFISNPQKDLSRGKHAHYKNQQVLFCLKGSVKMLLDDGKKKEEYLMTNPEEGVFLDRLIWHEMNDMDEDTILLVVASRKFEAKDYIRDYDKFKKVTASHK